MRSFRPALWGFYNRPRHERNEVTYAAIPCRSVLNRCQSERVPFQWTINPYKGCEFACAYCYARYTHEYLDLDGWLDFERKIFIKKGAERVLEREIGRRIAPAEAIAIGTATDPYQPVERRYEVTRRLLEKLAQRPGLVLSVTTKSDLVLRDLDLLTAIAAHSRLSVNVTITTLHRHLARVLEPRAPTPARRLAAIRRLAEAGLSVTLLLAPVMPYINDRRADLEQLVAQAAGAGASGVMAQLLFLRSAARKRFMPWLDEFFPRLRPVYEQLYGGDGALLEQHALQLQSDLEALRQIYGLGARHNGQEEAQSLPGRQMRLPL